MKYGIISTGNLSRRKKIYLQKEIIKIIVMAKPRNSNGNIFTMCDNLPRPRLMRIFINKIPVKWPRKF